MHYSATKKIPGGKLLRLKIEANGIIQKIGITGDFFLHPEEALPAIEKSLTGLSVQTTTQEFVQKIEQALAANKATFIGITSTDIANLISEILSEKMPAPRLNKTH